MVVRVTSDPVSPTDIADRLGLPYATVSGWKSRGLLPDPHWQCGNSPIWAWEELKENPTVRSVLEGFDRSAVLDYLPVKGDLGWVLLDTKAEWTVAQRRWERKGCGYVSVPVAGEGGPRLAVTDAVWDEVVTQAPRREVKRLLDEALETSGQLRAEGDWRKPLIAASWR